MLTVHSLECALAEHKTRTYPGVSSILDSYSVVQPLSFIIDIPSNSHHLLPAFGMLKLVD